MRSCGTGKLGKPDEQAHLPSPSFGTKHLMLDSFERWFKVGESLGMLSKGEIIQAHVNQGADLDIRHARRTPEFYTLPVILHRTSNIAKLAVKPSEGVRQTPIDKQVFALFRLRHPFMQPGERLGIVSGTPAGLTQEGQTEQLNESVMDITGYAQPLLTEV